MAVRLPHSITLALAATCIVGVAYGVGCGGSVDATPPTDTDTGVVEDASDTSTPTDTGVAPDGTPTDTGTPPTDTGTPPTDSGADVILPVDGGCPTGLTLCSGACVDLTKDLAHCGKCGGACPTGATCAVTSGGTPACTCPTGQIICGTKCIDVSTDAANCGACGKSCGSLGVCVSGACSCGTGGTMCGSICTDTAKDPLNCGGCGKRCGLFGACTSGACSCPAGTGVCSGSSAGSTECADTNADPDHCGKTGCGGTCGNRQYCDGTGTCVCRPGTTSCTIPGGATCLTLSGSPFACGACGTTCNSTQVCLAGKCVAGSTACTTGLTRCTFGGGVGAGCYDTKTDPTHCGSCATECNQNELCVNGACKAYIPATSCATCPCTDCATFFSGGGESATCCPGLKGHKYPVCVRGAACP